MPPSSHGRSRDRRRRWTLAVAYAALLASCDSPFAPSVEEVVRLEVSPPVLLMVAGGSATLTAQVFGADDSPLPAAKVFWSSQDPTVVTVNQQGVAMAVAAGTAQIAASAGGLSRTIAVTVSQRPIALVRISPPAGTVALGSTLTLQGEALDGTGTLLPNRVFDWSSSAPAIATVDALGVVTGVSVGQATISATGEGKTGTAVVTVVPAPVASITIQPDGGSLPAGGTMLLTATARDAAGTVLTGRRLEWTSSNDAVATVSSTGLLTAISAGVVTITVTAPGEGSGGSTPSATVQVTVLIQPVASAVIVPSTSSVQVGATVTLTVNLFDAGGEPLSLAGRTITWNSTNTAAATVNSSGTVTGIAVGSTTIGATVTTPGQPGTVQATAQVVVSNVPVASVIVSPSPATVHVGYTRAFTASVRDAQGVVLPGRSIVWTSSNQGIAVVDAVTGVVSGVNLGSAEIRATAEGVLGFSTVTIDLVQVSSVTVSPVSSTLMPGQTAQLTAVPRDSAGTPIQGAALGGRPTTWSTSNSGVATVSATGLVTAVAVGTASAIATIGGTAGNAPVTVTPLPSASQLAISTQPSATAQNDVAFAVQPVVQLKDASGNNVATAGVSIQAVITAPGTGTLGGTLTAITNASGAATFSGLKITGTTGARTLTFTSGSLAPATSAAINIQPGTATQLVITTPPPSTANSGQVFSSPTVVQLRDVSGNTVTQSGVNVTATVNPSAGVMLGGASAATNTSGTATFSALTLTGPAGSYTLTFSSGALTPATSGTITVGAGSGSRLTLTQQPSASAPNGVLFAQQPVVQLTDGSGNPVAQSGVVVSAAILTGGGALGGTTTATTNASGVASFSDLSITGTIGQRTLLFGATGYTTVTSNPIDITPGAATALTITAQPSANAQSGIAFATQPAVQVVDVSGNAVSQAGVSVLTSVNGAGASLIGSASASTNGSGLATFSGLGLSGTIGTYSLSFDATGLAGATSSSITLAAGAAAQLTITTQPAGAASGSAFTSQPAIQVRDAQGNAVSQAGITVSASVNGAGASLIGSANAPTNGAGLATFSGLGLSGTVGSYTLDFSASGLPNVTSGTIALAAGAPAQLTIATQPSATVISGNTLAQQPAVQVRDAAGNASTVDGLVVTAMISAGGATLTGSTTATSASGLATFSGLGITGTPGSYTLTFSAPGLTNATSSSITVTASVPTQITISTQPGGATSGSAFGTQPAIQLRDGGGNPVSQSGVTVIATIASGPGGGTLLGSGSAVTDASGLATFTGLGLSGTVGNYTLDFSSSGLPNVTSAAIALGPGAPAQMTILTQPAGGVSGAALATQPVIEVRDAQSNLVSQAVTVSAALNGGGSLIGSTTAQTSGGVATFSGLGVSGTVGNYTLDFSTAGAPNVTSASFALAAGAPAQLTMATQPSATVASGNALATPPAVQLRDGAGNAVSQAGVNVSVSIGAGASLTGSVTASTDGAGIATFTGLGITGLVGSYTLSFSGSGLTGTTSSAISVTPGAAAQLTITTQPSSTAISGSSFATQPVIQLRDASGNAVSQSGFGVSAALNGAGGSLTGTTSVATDGSGVAAFSGLGISGPAGSYTITFSGTSVTSVTSAAIAVTLPASALSISTQPSGASSGAPFTTQPTIQLVDANSAAVSQAGVQVTAALSGGSGSLVGGTTAITNASGLATFSGLGISGTVGNYTVTFSAVNLTSATSGTIALGAGAAAKLQITQEPAGVPPGGGQFQTQPVIQLLDARDNIVTTSGIDVTASLNASIGSCTLTGTKTVSTNASGVAAFGNLGINSSPCTATVTFSATGLTSATSGEFTASFFHLSFEPEAMTARDEGRRDERRGTDSPDAYTLGRTSLLAPARPGSGGQPMAGSYRHVFSNTSIVNP